MLDIKFVRENPELVKQNIKNKFQDSKLPLVDEVIDLDAKSRATKAEADSLRANRNKLSKQIGALMGQGKKDEAEEVKRQVGEDAKRLAELEEKEAHPKPQTYRQVLFSAFRRGRPRGPECWSALGASRSLSAPPQSHMRMADTQ